MGIWWVIFGTPVFFLSFSKFKQNVRWWKKYVFGNLANIIYSITKERDKINQDMANSYSDSLHNNLIQLQKEHQQALTQKEIYWKQRSRICWLKEGNNNTKFYHAFATNRKRCNMFKVLSLITINGLLMTKKFKKKIANNFKNIYTSNNNRNFSFDFINL